MYSTQKRKQQNEKKTCAAIEMYTEFGKDTKTTSSTKNLDQILA